ncbi:hypothetical protein LSTR_LSTR002394 [Laodelphax striatellus]|uniref:Uncharacterized protein n=1 Tax=Laodelphax striatellus TaxID=195883 RepID=A0A482X3Z9_LAOST|nr:hypothetical protein LSTR_LSTR002394 [Laodelphax striatellus]
MSFGSRRDTSSRERHSLNDIFRYKTEHAKFLWREFTGMVENDDGGRNETFLDFTKYIRDNSDYIKSLLAEIQERSPVAHPRFPEEASEQYMNSLHNELAELMKMIELKKKENLILKKEQKRFTKATEAIIKVIDEAESKKEEQEMVDAIERRILDLKFKEAKSRLNYILKTVFPNNGHEDVSNLLEKLFDDEENVDKWIEFSEEEYCLVRSLLKANIIQVNDENESEIRLLKS